MPHADVYYWGVTRLAISMTFYQQVPVMCATRNGNSRHKSRTPSSSILRATTKVGCYAPQRLRPIGEIIGEIYRFALYSPILTSSVTPKLAPKRRVLGKPVDRNIASNNHHRSVLPPSLALKLSCSSQMDSDDRQLEQSTVIFE
ncbi:hypothetical protein BOTBODRAFT_585708 [Botryobasidium botryosum FD-172 SS1]|uniref:Uncharacterized protein n=1 Tax=Botryobasidium botryosum (strain FD-172 SS1) TaxID=930990 RepID=A0A067M038_BOTB1|nr:hypothetical protein BOTBODRAFT_585708 [Botryobasidium botryosum FD-172 SS1]